MTEHDEKIICRPQLCVTKVTNLFASVGGDCHNIRTNKKVICFDGKERFCFLNFHKKCKGLLVDILKSKLKIYPKVYCLCTFLDITLKMHSFIIVSISTNMLWHCCSRSKAQYMHHSLKTEKGPLWGQDCNLFVYTCHMTPDTGHTLWQLLLPTYMNHCLPTKSSKGA